MRTFSLLGQALLWFSASKSGNSSILRYPGKNAGKLWRAYWYSAGFRLTPRWKWEGSQLDWKQNMGSEPSPAQPAWKHHRTRAGVFCVGTGEVRPGITSKQEAAHSLQIRHVTSELGQPCCFSALVTEKQLRLGQHKQYRSAPRLHPNLASQDKTSKPENAALVSAAAIASSQQHSHLQENNKSAWDMQHSPSESH